MTTSIHRLYQAQIDFCIMQRHCDVTQKGLKADLDDLELTMDNDLAGLNEYEQDAYFGNINDHWIETAETLPRLQWYAQLLIAFGYFEKLLNDVCANLQIERRISLSLKDLHGQGISRARNYLVKVALIDRPFAGQEWQKIKLIAELRNAVAHRDGYVDYEPNNEKSTYSHLSTLHRLELKQETINQPDAQIVFGPDMIVDVLDTFSRFSRSLSSELTDALQCSLK